MDEYTQKQCEIDYKVSFSECLETCKELETRLQVTQNKPATWPRVGTLLSIHNELREIVNRLPKQQEMSEAEKIEQAALRG